MASLLRSICSLLYYFINGPIDIFIVGESPRHEHGVATLGGPAFAIVCPID
jgi:hypothetical protein